MTPVPAALHSAGEAARALLAGLVLGLVWVVGAYVALLPAAMILRAILGLPAGLALAQTHVAPLALACLSSMLAPIFWKSLIPDVMAAKMDVDLRPRSLVFIHAGLTVATLLAFLVSVLVWRAAEPGVLTGDGGLASGLFVVEITAKAVFLDLFEHFRLNFSGAEIDLGHRLFALYTFAYRTFFSLMMLDLAITWWRRYRVVEKGAAGR